MSTVRLSLPIAPSRSLNAVGIGVSAIVFAAAFTPSATASLLTLSNSADVEVSQTGRYRAEVSFFRKSSHGWRWLDPDRGSGYNWVGWGFSFPDLVIPQGSTIESATLDWSRSGPSTEVGWKTHDWYCKGGGRCIGSTVDSFQPDAFGMFQYVESGGRKHWFTDAYARGQSGTVDLLELGFGSDLLNSRYVSVGGNEHLHLGRIYMNEGWNTVNEWDVWGTARMTVNATLAVAFTPPAPSPVPPPAETPEPSTLWTILTGVGLCALGRIRSVIYSASTGPAPKR